MIPILTVIAPLFLIIFATAFLQKFKNIGSNWSTVLNEFALKIGLPVLIFSALSKATFSFSKEIELIVSNSIFIILCFFLALIVGKIFRLKKERQRTLSICFIFGNTAYLGLPVLLQVYGEKVAPTATLIIAIYLFWTFTLGIGYLDYSMKKKESEVIKDMFKNIFRNPLLIAVILGILVGALKIELPGIVVKSLDMITAAVTPTVLIVIGLFIGMSKIGKLKEWFPVLLFSLATLILLPGIFYFGVKIFGYDPSQFSASIIQAAMPLAITPFALADQYHLDKVFIARSIVLSTILSAIFLPFWISIL